MFLNCYWWYSYTTSLFGSKLSHITACAYCITGQVQIKKGQYPPTITILNLCRVYILCYIYCKYVREDVCITSNIDEY